MTELLTKDHKILEKGMMKFQPFGISPSGEKIRDVSGTTVLANVAYLEEVITKANGPESGPRAVDELVRLLNDRVRDPAYHVSPKFLRNVWNSYSYEFVMFLAEFCERISGDPQFQAHVGQRFISPLIQTLGRPFPVSQIYKMFAHFGDKFVKGSVQYEIGTVTDCAAILRMKFTENVYRQFGPYRKACAGLACECVKSALSSVPERIHHLKPAVVKDRTCIVNGDEWCEWEFTWSPRPDSSSLWLFWGVLASSVVLVYLLTLHSEVTPAEAFAIALLPGIASWLATRHPLQKEIKILKDLIQEQDQAVEARHEALREAYLEQQQTSAELSRKVSQLITLHHAGLLFGSTLDRETLLQNVLETLIHELHYDRAMLSFYDPERGVSYDARLIGVPDDIASFARSLEVPCTDPSTIEGTVLLQGEPILVGDLREEWNRLHPFNQQLATIAKAKTIIAVPLKIKDRVIGSLTVDRTQEHSLTQDDLNLLVTVGNQVAIALEKAAAYRQIEELNLGLEAKVRERTVELERLNRELKTANDQLQELDRLKSEFFANISHELRTPLSLSLGAFKVLSNLSPTTEAKKLIQAGLRNNSRLLFLINELLDLAKFDSGLVELRTRCIDFAALVRAVAANFESGERRRIHLRGMESPVPLEADANQMKKVLYNLLSNALKFSDPDRGQVWLRLSSKADWVELEVEDNGIGIPHDQLERIFDRFTQVEGSATRRYEGTGIGLALVKEIVTSHKGKITVESELGRGSTFTIALPRGAASPDTMATIEDDEPSMLPIWEEKPPERTSAEVSSPAASGDRPLLLVADDNTDMRAHLKRLLNRQYRIVLAKDGVEGLEQAKAFHPDLIITDVMMPRMSGYELLKAVRGDNALRSIPIIILTARAGTEAQVESWEAGADDYIAKPFDESELLARVNNLIRARSQERELLELQKEKLTRFLPAPLAEMILADRADEVLKSHRAEITVVFIDLRGFTAFAETAEPEDVAAVLQKYQSEMGRLISEHHGMIERFSGDAMMIFFNDPIPVPNHAEQAVRLAIGMRHRIEQLKQEWSQRGIHLGAGIGVATGYATLGLIGFEKRRDYAAIGPVTNLAARLCGEAQHGQILISERVLHLVKDLVCSEPVGTLTLKGFHKPVLAYNVAGLAGQRPRRNGEKTKKDTGK